MKNWIRGLVIVVLVVLAYMPILTHPVFKTMDDEYSIIHNELIKDVRHIPEILKSPFFEGRAYYRPLVSLSFMLDYHLFGLNPFFYYLTNLILHMLISFTVWALANFLLKNRNLAWGVAVLFAIHPIHWEAISNIPGRAILLCAFFYLNAFLCFLHGQQKRDWRFFALSLICFLLGLLSKESAVVFPILLIWYQWIVNPSRKPFLQRFFVVMPFMALEIAYWIWRKSLGMTQLFFWRSFQEGVLGFVTFLYSLGTHVQLLIFPFGLQFDRSQEVFHSFMQPDFVWTIFVFLNLIVIFVATLLFMPALILFFVGWFFIELLPVSQIWVSIGVAPGYISTADHFLYIASISFFILLGVGVDWSLTYLKSKRLVTSPTLTQLSIAGIYLIFFFGTLQQNFYSRNEISMFEQTLEKAPYNTRIRESLALIYARIGRFEDAEKHFRLVVEQAPWDTRAQIGLGKSLVDQRKFWEGIQEYERVQSPGPWKELLEKNTVAAYRLLIERYQKMLKEDSDDAQVWYSLGVVYSKSGEVDLAIESYEKTLILQPDFQNALFNLAGIHYGAGDFEKAKQYYEQMLSLPVEENDELRHQAEIHLKDISSRSASQ
ncbi:MAG: tetratricopeptide repeat protein [Candidatus Omnitrophica bacterium]|nr:tetratricopeptide repeat protein [Candidatus Omnitrophota bacterium]